MYMSTQKETIEFMLEKLGNSHPFSVRAMFGEYALYAYAKVVGLVCDDQLYVKILPASKDLEGICEKDTPYPGAKLHYVIEERELSTLHELPDILADIALSLPEKKVKKTKIKKSRVK